MLVVIFERATTTGSTPNMASSAEGSPMEEARRIIERLRGRWEGEGPARRWLTHRYAVSYRQAPVLASGAFVDTFEVAAEWSKLGALYEAVRSALGAHVFVMAHFSHAYPDGCCIYFSFAGSATAKGARRAGWDDACEITYDHAWRAALKAAVDAGGTLAHHHGVGRSKAPRLSDELGIGVDVVRGLMRGFDPRSILNPGNLLPNHASSRAIEPPAPRPSVSTSESAIAIDRTSLLACVVGTTDLHALERHLNDAGLTLDARIDSSTTVAEWLARGAPGARDRWLDPVDQLLAGLEATLADGRVLRIRPAPRRSVGPDLTALFVGAGGRFGRIDRAWLRVHPRGVRRPSSAPFRHEREPPLNAGEQSILDAIARGLRN